VQFLAGVLQLDYKNFLSFVSVIEKAVFCIVFVSRDVTLCYKLSFHFTELTAEITITGICV